MKEEKETRVIDIFVKGKHFAFVVDQDEDISEEQEAFIINKFRGVAEDIIEKQNKKTE
jgi:hypothetical protein